MKIAVVTTHPIQYQVPWIRLLAREPGVEVVVLFAMLPDAEQQGAGFGMKFEWDVPLLDGYHYRLLRNVAARPSVVCRNGCDTPEVGDVLREERPDVVLVNGWVAKTCLQALAACRRLGIPCLVRGESNTLRPRPLWKRLLHRVHLRRYSAFLAIGKSNRGFYLAHGVRPGKIFDTPYCVDNRFFSERAAEARADRHGLRARWGVPRDATVFLFVGKFEAKKRPFDLLQCARLLRDERRRIHFLMAGSGDLLERCRETARVEALPVSFTGFLNQGGVPAAYAAADALILPSDHGETWGLVVNEAMACGLPAYVSDEVGCHPDLIVPEVTGRVFPKGRVESLASMIREDVARPGRLASMGEAARTRVARYCFEAVAAGVMQAANHLVAR